MIKKFTRNIIYTCDLPRNFAETVIKENLQTYQKNPNMEQSLS